MVRNHLLLAAVICVSIATVAAHGDGKSDTPLTSIADQVIRAREATMQEKSNAQDVENFLSYCMDDFVYEDPVVNMRNAGKSQIREGMVHFLGASKNASWVVKKKLAAGNAVMLEITVSFTDADTGKVVTRDQITVLEFQGTKVRRILDYWTRS